MSQGVGPDKLRLNVLTASYLDPLSPLYFDTFDKSGTEDEYLMWDCEFACGDGLVVGEEQCDDGNLVAFDGCDASCEAHSGDDVMSACGNVEPGFVCDGQGKVVAPHRIPRDCHQPVGRSEVLDACTPGLALSPPELLVGG
ncbi:hypothetical protein AK812_SmicGene29711 [Symbiodinium microadriaticum]|uniref:Uncharacterized protein n=1 Tax=Symbiodinium microadriaticum TaxID=2951 RepID=A0A1Q9D142_SYMMI|nr:hypothetical protein AK812_SmicGene29711 [Symbiodinium microadriaticum]